MNMNEKIKNYLGIALILGIVVLGYVGVNFALHYPQYPGRSFSVSGEGEVVGIPDVGRFSFSILSEGPELQALQKQHTAKSDAVIDFLKKQGIEDKDIKSEGYSIYPTYTYHECNYYGICPPATISGYRIEHSLSVTVRNLDNSGLLLGGVVEYGANNVSGFSFEVDDPDNLELEARAAAIADAKAKAEQMAKAGGFRVGKMIGIYFQDMTPYYGYGMGAGEEAYSYPTPRLEPGSQKITSRVDITYEIK